MNSSTKVRSAGAGQAGGTFDIVTGCAEQVETRLCSLFGIIQYGCYRRSTAFFSSSGGFHRIGDQTVLDVTGRGVHIKTGAGFFGSLAVATHQPGKLFGHFWGGTAVDQFLLDAIELRKFREDGCST